MEAAVELFIKDKRVQGVTPGVMKKYALELDRLRGFCVRQGVYTVNGLTRDLLTEYCSTWEQAYPSSITRSKVRERLRSFLRYCYEAQWLDRIPQLPKIKADEPPTLPLSPEEYRRLLDALYVVNPLRWDGKTSARGLTDDTRAKVGALIQLMRWSGLAIRDAVTLRRSALQQTAAGFYRVVTSRQKTGTDVSVPIPPAVAEEILSVSEGEYLFWTGEGTPETIAKTWANRYLRPLFNAAGLPSGHMVSHRIRDTFAVDLLEKGIPMEEVSKLLGHESIKTTERHYAKWVKGRQERLDALVTGTWV
jgi:integrase